MSSKPSHSKEVFGLLIWTKAKEGTKVGEGTKVKEGTKVGEVIFYDIQEKKVCQKLDLAGQKGNCRVLRGVDD